MVNQFEEYPLVLASRNQSREEDRVARAQELANAGASFSTSNLNRKISGQAPYDEKLEIPRSTNPHFGQESNAEVNST